MKNSWRFVMALLIGSSVLMASGVTTAFARPKPPQDQGEKDHGQEHAQKKQKQEHAQKKQNQGHGQKMQNQARGQRMQNQARGQRMQTEARGQKMQNQGRRMRWQPENGRYTFNNHDRSAVTTYFRTHRYAYARERVPEVPLAYGYVFAPRYRRYCHPAPLMLVEELPPPPPGYRYFLFGGNVVLLDGGYRVQDFIHIGINIGL